MQRLRVLTSSPLPGLQPDAAPWAAVAAMLLLAAVAGGAAAETTSDEKPTKLAVGDTLELATPFTRVFPEPGTVQLAPRKGRPLAVLFWGLGDPLSQELLLELETFASEQGIGEKMDVLAVASYKEDSLKHADIKDAALLAGASEISIVADPGFTLSRTVGAQQFPDLALFDKDGRLLVRGLRSLNHDRLSGSRRLASDLLKLVASEGTAELVRRTFPYYPASELLRRRYPDFELPRFSKDGWGKAPTERLSHLLSGERPAVLLFFSSTCTHCQKDVPQLVEFLSQHPRMYDVVGITRIKHERHRAYSDRYFKEQRIPFPILEDVGPVSDLYRVNSTPTAFYISPGGAIVSISYYQHQDLAADYLKLHATLMGAPPPAPLPRSAETWAFPLKVKDEKGSVLDLSTLQGKPTLLHFWATWCAPCREELPSLLRRLPELQKLGNVLLVSVEDESAKVAAYRKKLGRDFPSYLSPHGGLAEEIDFGRSVPRTFVLDERGAVTKTLRGSYDWEDDERYGLVAGRMATR